MAGKVILWITLALIVVGWGAIGVFLAGNGLYHNWQAAQYEPLTRQAPLPHQICQTSACVQAIDAKLAQIAESSQARNYWLLFGLWLIYTFELWTAALVIVIIVVAIQRKKSQYAFLS